MDFSGGTTSYLLSSQHSIRSEVGASFSSGILRKQQRTTPFAKRARGAQTRWLSQRVRVSEFKCRARQRFKFGDALFGPKVINDDERAELKLTGDGGGVIGVGGRRSEGGGEGDSWSPGEGGGLSKTTAAFQSTARPKRRYARPCRPVTPRASNQQSPITHTHRPAAHSTYPSNPNHKAKIVLFSPFFDLPAAIDEYEEVQSGAFLREIGLTQYQQAFTNLSRQQLANLCMRHLPLMSITQFDHQKQIMDAFRKQIAQPRRKLPPLRKLEQQLLLMAMAILLQAAGTLIQLRWTQAAAVDDKWVLVMLMKR